MSFIDMYRSKVAHLRREMAQLQRQKASAVQERSRITSRAVSAQRSISSSSSESTIKSKLGEIDRLNRELARCEEKIARIETQSSDKATQLGRAEEQLSREEASVLRTREEAQRRLDDQRRRQMQAVESTLRHHGGLHKQTRTTLDQLSQVPELIRVLFFAANPLDQEELRLDEEVRQIEQRIRMSDHRDSVELRSKWAVRTTDLIQALNEVDPVVVHFSGHGSEHDEIVFQDDLGQSKPVKKEAITQLIAATAGNIRLVVFNTCYSREQALAVVQHVDAAIGVSSKIADQAARVFAAQLYSSIGFGKSVRQSFEQARAQLLIEGVPDNEIPELFVRDGLNASEIVLVNPKSGSDGDSQASTTDPDEIARQSGGYLNN